MACVIQFVLGGSNPDYDNIQHFYWMFLLATIIIRGPGVLSIDHYIRKSSLDNLASALEGQTRAAGKNLLAVAIADVADEVGFDLAVGPESGIEYVRIKSAHGAAI